MTRRDAIDLDDVLTLLTTGTNVDQIAARIGVRAESIVRAYTRHVLTRTPLRAARARHGGRRRPTPRWIRR